MIETHLELLGTPMIDIVTGFSGMVDSVAFDAYGCVLATLASSVDEKGEVPESRWFDVKRLRSNGKRIMDVPPHFTTPPGKEIGAATKPQLRQLPKRGLQHA